LSDHRFDVPKPGNAAFLPQVRRHRHGIGAPNVRSTFAPRFKSALYRDASHDNAETLS
jgi:hypothetical protein